MTQMSKFILFVSAEILFNGNFSLWVSLNYELPIAKLHVYWFSGDSGGKTKQKQNWGMNQEKHF